MCGGGESTETQVPGTCILVAQAQARQLSSSTPHFYLRLGLPPRVSRGICASPALEGTASHNHHALSCPHRDVNVGGQGRSDVVGGAGTDHGRRCGADNRGDRQGIKGQGAGTNDSHSCRGDSRVQREVRAKNKGIGFDAGSNTGGTERERTGDPSLWFANA